MSKCLDPFRFLLICLAGWMNQQWPASPARSSRAVVTAATLVSVMNGWRAGGMRRVHDFGVSCLIRGVSWTLADSQIPKFRTEMQPLVGLGIRRIGFSGHTRLRSLQPSRTRPTTQPSITGAKSLDHRRVQGVAHVLVKDRQSCMDDSREDTHRDDANYAEHPGQARPQADNHPFMARVHRSAAPIPLVPVRPT